MNVLIHEAVRKHRRFRAGPDFETFFLRNPQYLSDGIHPDGLGHAVMAIMWLHALKIDVGGIV